MTDFFGPATPGNVFSAAPAPKPTSTAPASGAHHPTGTPKPGTPNHPATSTDAALSGAQRDAYQALKLMFASYGLDSLAPDILKFVQQGYSQDTVALMLQDTDAYKKRFSANAARVKAGLPALTPAQYLATEDAYRQSMRAAGLPSGFYDSKDDFTNFIAADVSPSEMNTRIQLAQQATVDADPSYKTALSQMGLTQGDMTAYFLDPTKAAPVLQKQAAAAQVGAEAIRRGLQYDQPFAMQLVNAGVSQSQAAQGYQQIGSEYDRLQGIAQQYGMNWSYGQEEQATFGLNSEAALQQQRLASWQRANVNGNVGGAQGGLVRHGGGQLA